MQAIDLYNALGQPRPASSSSPHPNLITLLDHNVAPPDIGEYPDATYVNYKPLGLSFCYEPPASSPSSKTGQSKSKIDRTLAFIDIFNPPPNPPPRRRKPAYDGYSSPRLPLTFHFPSSTIPLPPRPAPKAPPGAPAGMRVRKEKEDPDQPKSIERDMTFEVLASTTAGDFVRHFGEPTRKGEGEVGYVPAFMEWEGVEIVPRPGGGGRRDGDDGELRQRGDEAPVPEREVVRLGIMVELLDPGVKPAMGLGGPKSDGGLWDRAGEWVWVGLKVFKAS